MFVQFKLAAQFALPGLSLRIGTVNPGVAERAAICRNNSERRSAETRL